MLTKIEGIVLQTIRHNDKNNIVALYTRQRGRVTFLSPVSSSKRGKLRNARLGLMSVVEAQVNFKESRELQFLGHPESPMPWKNIYFDPMKSSITFFMAEFLNKLLRGGESDPNMWDFIIASMRYLDRLEKGVANFHLAFLIRLLPLTGIEPDISAYQPGMAFDMQTAEFFDQESNVNRPESLSVKKALHLLDPSEASNLRSLARMNYRNMHLFRFTVEERRRLLSGLLRYYNLHLPVSSDLKSPEVLQTLFV